ncbi:cytochrome P450 [Aspergillus recurvatus]
MLSNLPTSMEAPWAEMIIGSSPMSIIARSLWKLFFPCSTPNGSTLPQVDTFLPFGIDYIIRRILYSAQNKSMLFWEELFQKHHPLQTLEIRLGLADRDCIPGCRGRQGLASRQFGDFGKGERFHSEWQAFLGDAIFTTDGDKWHANMSTFERHVQKLLGILREGENQPFNAFDLCLRLSMDIATDFLLGQSVNSLSTPADEFSAASADVQRIQSWITMAGPLQAFLPKAKYHEVIKPFNAFVDPFIRQTLALDKPRSKPPRKPRHLHARPKAIRDQLISALLAARDTTAATLAGVLYQLSGHPDAVQRLRAEIHERVGPTDIRKPQSHALPPGGPQGDAAPVPGHPVQYARCARGHHTTAGGGPSGTDPVHVEKDTLVAYSPLYMHRSDSPYPKTYANGTAIPDPREFRPERWVSHGSGWVPKPWTYIPFNGGPHICLGQQFALTEMGYTLVRIFQKYRSVETVG